MKHTEEYNWSFGGKNSKGEVKFKHKTNEPLDEVLDYLEGRGLDYELVDEANMIWVYANDAKYYYYYTTGRWAKYSEFRPPSMHYHATGVKDFLDRFILAKNRKKPNFTKIQNDIDKMIFKDIKEAGEGGIIQKDIREKYKDLPDWKYHKVKGSFSRLIKKGLVFYTGEKIGRSKVMRCVDLEKLDIFKEEK